MLLSIPVAVGLGLYNPAWFFPAMLLIIAGRYLTFATLGSIGYSPVRLRPLCFHLSRSRRRRCPVRTQVR